MPSPDVPIPRDYRYARPHACSTCARLTRAPRARALRLMDPPARESVQVLVWAPTLPFDGRHYAPLDPVEGVRRRLRHVPSASPRNNAPKAPIVVKFRGVSAPVKPKRRTTPVPDSWPATRDPSAHPHMHPKLCSPTPHAPRARPNEIGWYLVHQWSPSTCSVTGDSCTASNPFGPRYSLQEADPCTQHSIVRACSFAASQAPWEQRA